MVKLKFHVYNGVHFYIMSVGLQFYGIQWNMHYSTYFGNVQIVQMTIFWIQKLFK